MALDGVEGEIAPLLVAGQRRGERVAREPPGPAGLEGVRLFSSPPTARQWNTSEYSGTRVKPRRSPSSTAMSPTTSQWMPVSSATSFTATSAAE